METTAKPLPFEKTLVRLALHASIGNAAQQEDPLPFNDANMTAGANIYKEHCAFCHGLPQEPPTFASRGMFPRPPQLFEQTHMVRDKPEGVLYWKVTHGISLVLSRKRPPLGRVAGRRGRSARLQLRFLCLSDPVRSWVSPSLNQESRYHIGAARRSASDWA